MMSLLGEFDNLVEEMFNYVMKQHPIYATYMGLHQFDGYMPDGSRESNLKDIKSMRHYLSLFESFPNDELSRDKSLDRDLAIHGLKLELFEQESLRFWESIPEGVNTLGDALFPLIAKNFAPFESRLDSMLQRIEKAPKFLVETKSRIQKPVKLWVEIAAESSKNLPYFLDTIISNAKSNHLNTPRLENAINDLCNNLKEYEDWLLTELMPKAQDEFAIGQKKFDNLLLLRGFDMDSYKILAFGESSIIKEKQHLNEISKKIDPSISVQQVKAKIKSKHPASFEDALNTVKQTVQDAKQFVVENGYATIPEGEDLLVMETPSYLKHIIPFAAYFGPARFESSKVGIYITTHQEEKTDSLVELNYASMANTAVHEGYPGHHLQLTYNALNPSLVRSLFSGTEFIEGWAHYCEEAMRLLGWRNTLEAQFMQTVDLIWRAARIIIDVKISTNKISFENAVNILVKETGMVKSAATAEVKRYTYTPGYQLSYYLGKHLIKGLKNDAKKLWGERFSDGRFHNLLLSSGGMPVKFLKQIIIDSKT
jgi:hypothetical protein|tara:strand:- start:6270 stop:7886 length:1617 start_codon:yes stop_codon:yes gene_type:complete